MGVVLGYGRLDSYLVLDYEHYVQTRGQAHGVNTRDAAFCRNFLSLTCTNRIPTPCTGSLACSSFLPTDLTATADVDGRCTLCGMWAAF